MSTAAYYGLMETEEAGALLATMGLDCCEVFLECASEYTPGFAGMMRDALGGLPAHSVHPKGTQFEDGLFGKSPRQCADALRVYEDVLRAGQALGAQVYVFHGAPDIYRRGTGPNMRAHRDVLLELCQRAQAYGMVFAWENVWWCQLAKPEHVALVRDAVPEVRFVLDIKQAAHAGHDPLAYADIMRGALVNVHVCDMDADGQLYLPGQGSYDFHALFASLASSGYDGPVILEPYSNLFSTQLEIVKALEVLRAAFP